MKNSTLDAWVGKWVVVTPIVPICGTLSILTGRLREITGDGCIIEMHGITTALNNRHIVAIQLPSNQDAFTIESMSLMQPHKEM